MAITSSFGDLGVVLNAPTNRRDGLITSSGITVPYMHLSHLGLLHVILIKCLCSKSFYMYTSVHNTLSSMKHMRRNVPALSTSFILSKANDINSSSSGGMTAYVLVKLELLKETKQKLRWVLYLFSI